MLAPACCGLVLAGGIFVVFGLPMLGRIDLQRQRLAELEIKGKQLPQLENQLKAIDGDLAEVEQLQTVLVDLVAGRGSIQTFLAQLSRESAASGVVIRLYEPVSVPVSSVRDKPSSSEASAEQNSGLSSELLESRGYEKSSVLLQVDGPYLGLLQFLRRMEQLELLVQPSDLELTALELRDSGEQSATIGPPRTRLKLTLSFFDKAVRQGTVGTDSNPSSKVHAPF